MSDYSRLYNFAAKDALSSGDPSKLIRGSEMDGELDAIATAIATKANDSAVVHNTGNETIAGNKTLTGTTTISGALTSSGGITMSGKSIEFAEGADVASASTTNIWGSDGNTVHVTGTTTITSFGTAPQAGAQRRVIFDGALTLTHGANLNLPGALDINTAAGDTCLVYADTTTQLDVLDYQRASVVPLSGSLGLSKLTSGSAVGSSAVSIVMTSYTSFRHKLLILSNVLPSVDAREIRFQVSTDGGSSFDGSGYSYGMVGSSDAGAAVATGSASANFILLTDQSLPLSNSTNRAGYWAIYMYDTTAGIYPKFNWFSNYISSSGPAGMGQIGWGQRLNAQDTDAVQVFAQTGNISLDYALYGFN